MVILSVVNGMLQTNACSRIELLVVGGIMAAIVFVVLTTAGEKAMAADDAGGLPMNCLLFFDDWMLQTREGLDRMQGQPVLLADVTPPLPEHLSQALNWWGILLFDEHVGRYVTYMDCWTAAPERMYFRVRVESDDPTDWPDLRGDRAAETLKLSNENVVVDENGKPLSGELTISPLAGTPLADKGYVLTCANRQASPPARLAFSPDGVHCHVVADNVWKPWGSDTWNGVVYDPVRERYMIFCRPYEVDRRVARVLTTDFQSFSPPEVVLQPDAEDPINREFYGMYNTRYEDMFVGCLLIYDTEPTEKSMLKWVGSIETQLTYSHNGEHWYRAFRDRMFVGRGAAGTPTGGMVFAGAPVRTPDDRLLFGVRGISVDHGSGPGERESFLIYELRLDGFAYLRTRARHGMIRTKALIPAGDELTLNVRTNRSGYVKVQVLDAVTFEPMPHYTLDEAIPITGDHLFGRAQWRDRHNIAELKGRPVILEVHVREGELYALRLPYKAFYTSWIAHRI